MVFKTALVLDDDGTWRDIISRQLEQHYQGIKVTEVGSAAEAKEKVTKIQQYDLYTLCGLRGDWKDVAQHIRSLQSDAKIVLFSATPNQYGWGVDARDLRVPVFDKEDVLTTVPKLEKFLA